MHSLGQFSLTPPHPNSKWKLLALKSPLLRLVVCPIKQRLIGCRGWGGRLVGEGCDAAAKSFICRAERLSINEVVKGGDICGGRGERERFSQEASERLFALAGFPSFID